MEEVYLTLFHVPLARFSQMDTRNSRERRGMPTFMPWEDKKAGVGNTNQPLLGTGRYWYLLEPDVILQLHPSCTWGLPWGIPGSWQNSTAPSSENQEPTESACQDSSFFRPSSSEHPFPDVLFSGKEDKQLCVAPHGKAGTFLNTAPRGGHPPPILPTALPGSCSC